MKWTHENMKLIERRKQPVRERYVYSVLLEKELWKKAHIAAIKQGRDLSDVLRELLGNYASRVEQT